MSKFHQNVQAVRQNLRNLFPETPLQYNHFLSKRYKAKIYLKREDLSPVRSYKIRGAFNLISSRLEKGTKDQKFVCASAGNHAQGFAFVCHHFKVPGTVFMPITTPEQKIKKTKVFGGKYISIELIGDTFDEAYSAAQKFCNAHKASMIPPFDHPKIIEGQATVAAEIIDQIPEKQIDILIMPVGGGGLSAGCTKFFKTESPKTKLFCCEPLEAPSLFESLKAKKRITLKSMSTFVDGAAVALVGEHNFKILKEHIKNTVLLIPENRLCATLLECLNHEGFVLEPAGALAIDALKNFKPAQLKDKTIVCVASGGNFDFERLPEVKERAMRYTGVKKYFILRLPQRPGALREFLNILGPDDDIARFEYLKKSTNFGSVLLGIETSKPENFQQLLKKMEQKGFTFQDVTDDELLAGFLI